MSDQPISRFPVPELDDLPEKVRDQILQVQERTGFVPNVFLVLAHRPDEFRAFFSYYDALMAREGGLSKDEREMIVVATSAANHCLYCVISHGAMLGVFAKEPLLADQIATNYTKAPITDRQRAMLDFALLMANDSHLARPRLHGRRHLGHRRDHGPLRPFQPHGQSDGHAAQRRVLRNGPQSALTGA